MKGFNDIHYKRSITIDKKNIKKIAEFEIYPQKGIVDFEGLIPTTKPSRLRRHTKAVAQIIKQYENKPLLDRNVEVMAIMCKLNNRPRGSVGEFNGFISDHMVIMAGIVYENTRQVKFCSGYIQNCPYDVTCVLIDLWSVEHNDYYFPMQRFASKALLEMEQRKDQLLLKLKQNFICSD